jgi:hypothetical protein
LDPTLSCPDGRLTVLVSDGFLRSTPTAGASTDIVATPKLPDAAIYGLPDGGSRLDWQSVPLRGSGKDPEDGELTGSSLHWEVSGPCPSAAPCGAPTVLTATGTAADVRPGSGRWATGWYQEALTVTDSTARTDVARSWFLVQADADIDGIPAPLDRGSCTNGTPSGASLDNDPTNASGDLDGDGIPNGADPAPCVAATERLATIVFDPMTLYVPSAGNTVTTYISVAGTDMRRVDGASIKIARINGEDPGAPSVAACKVSGGLPATAYTATASTGTAKFDRQKLNRFLACMGFVGRVDQIYITGSAPSASPPWSFSGITATNVQPGS